MPGCQDVILIINNRIKYLHNQVAKLLWKLGLCVSIWLHQSKVTISNCTFTSSMY